MIVICLQPEVHLNVVRLAFRPASLNGKGQGLSTVAKVRMVITYNAERAPFKVATMNFYGVLATFGQRT